VDVTVCVCDKISGKYWHLLASKSLSGKPTTLLIAIGGI